LPPLGTLEPASAKSGGYEIRPTLYLNPDIAVSAGNGGAFSIQEILHLTATEGVGSISLNWIVPYYSKTVVGFYLA